MSSLLQSSTDTQGLKHVKCYMLETMPDKMAHNLLILCFCVRAGPGLKLISLSPFHRHIIPFILRGHLLALPPSPSHPPAHSAIPVVSAGPWFQLRHWCTDAKVSGQGEQLENTRQTLRSEVTAPPGGPLAHIADPAAEQGGLLL